MEEKVLPCNESVASILTKRGDITRCCRQAHRTLRKLKPDEVVQSTGQQTTRGPSYPVTAARILLRPQTTRRQSHASWRNHANSISSSLSSSHSPRHRMW